MLPNLYSAMSASPDADNLTLSDIDLNFLPRIYEVIRGVEKEPVDTKKTSQEIVQKIQDLQVALEKAREQLCLLPGLQYSQKDQSRQLAVLRDQLKHRQALVRRYQQLDTLALQSDPGESCAPSLASPSGCRPPDPAVPNTTAPLIDDIQLEYP